MNIKKGIRRILFLFAIIISIYYIYSCINKEDKIKQLLNSFEKDYASITNYTLFGTHFNISGNLNLNDSDGIENIELVLLDINKEEIIFPILYTINENSIDFSTSTVINEGINLESLSNKDFYLALKIKENDSYKYYSFINKTKYKDITYYKIIDDYKYEIKFNEKDNYLMFSNTKEEKPDAVYDIVIDAGHGGTDSGATYNGYNESTFTLNYALSLKEELTKLGLKVKLTREDDSYLRPYGTNGRAIIPNEVNAKYLISLHLNSVSIKFNVKGVEVYAPYNTNLTFARSLIDNIIKEASTTYSNNANYKVENGIYVRTMSSSDVSAAIESAKTNNYNIPNVSNSTNYLFMIRETGGIMTGAYIDGSNTAYGSNPYYNSNVGVESYLIELGYIISNDDLNNIINNKDKYIQGITKAIKQELNLK